MDASAGSRGSTRRPGFGLTQMPSLTGCAAEALFVSGRPAIGLIAQKCAPPMIPFGSSLQAVWVSPPPRSSVTTRSLPSGVMSDWWEMATLFGLSTASMWFGAIPMIGICPLSTLLTSTITVSSPTSAV